MKQIYTDNTGLVVTASPSVGNAVINGNAVPPVYQINLVPLNPLAARVITIPVQSDDVGKVGVNGVSPEAVLAILTHLVAATKTEASAAVDDKLETSLEYVQQLLLSRRQARG